MIPEHPQTAFCKADFVVRVKILGKVKKDIRTPPPAIVLGDSFINSPSLPTSPDNLDDSSTADSTTPPVGKKSSIPLSLQKPVDMPPGEDITEKPSVQPSMSVRHSLLGRHRRSLGLGIRGAPPPPPASNLYNRPFSRRGRDKGMMYYDVLIKKVFKGGDKVRNTKGTFIDAANPRRFFARIYFSPYHGQELEAGVAYMLSGKIMNNELLLPNSGCWMEKWEDLSKEEKHGLHGKYAKNCDCRIRFCVPGFCDRLQAFPLPSQCAWELRNFREPSRDCGARHNLCIKHQNECHWTVGKGFDSCLNPAVFP